MVFIAFSLTPKYYAMRKNGNTARLAQSFAEGAANNNNVEIVPVADYKGIKDLLGG